MCNNKKGKQIRLVREVHETMLPFHCFTSEQMVQKKQQDTKKFASLSVQNEKCVADAEKNILNMRQQQSQLQKKLKEETEKKRKLELAVQKDQQQIKVNGCANTVRTHKRGALKVGLTRVQVFLMLVHKKPTRLKIRNIHVKYTSCMCL